MPVPAGNPNAVATHYILPGIAANPGIVSPPAGLKRPEVLRDFDPKLRRSLSRMRPEIWAKKAQFAVSQAPTCSALFGLLPRI
jgi:hypothetical protein